MIYTTESAEELTRENILKQVSELQLWKYYTNTEVRHGRHIKGDTSAVFYIKDDKTILLKDFAKKTYNIWTFLMYKYKKSFGQILQQIANDFELNFPYIKGPPTMQVYGSEITQQIETPIKTPTSIRVCTKAWTKFDQLYWQPYGITKDNLELDKCYSLDHFWIIKNDTTFKIQSSTTNPIYCWFFGDNKYKIYTPFSPDPKYRWINNVNANYLFGEHLLPQTGDLLIITKSGKDRIVLSNLDYVAVGVQNEKAFPTPNILNDLKYRFNTVLVFFDNDKTGIEGAEKLNLLYNFKNIMVPKDETLNISVKDVSDYYKQYGKEKTTKLCQFLIKNTSLEIL